MSVRIALSAKSELAAIRTHMQEAIGSSSLLKNDYAVIRWSEVDLFVRILGAILNVCR